jgi:hypothetical protein
MANDLYSIARRLDLGRLFTTIVVVCTVGVAVMLLLVLVNP